MAEVHKPDPARSGQDAQPAPDPRSVIAGATEVNAAPANLSRRRFGCLAQSVAFGVILFLLLAVFVYWNLVRTPPLIISRETNYFTEPLTADGTRVDYLAALERDFYPPEMKTDDNGYRLIVRALGVAPDNGQASGHVDATAVRAAQVYEKLGLDPAVRPTMTCTDPYDFLQDYGVSRRLQESQIFELFDRYDSGPWTLDDLPMMGPWLEENGPVIDLVGEAVRKPTFCIPLVRPDGEPLPATIVRGEQTIECGEDVQRARTFARMAQARAFYRIGSGDIDGAIDDVITCKRLGRHFQCQRTIVARLVGIAIEGLANYVGVAGNHAAQPTDVQLQRLVDELSALPHEPGIDEVLLAERCCTLDLIQAVAHGDRPRAMLVPPGDQMGSFTRGVVTRLPVDWNVVMRQINAQCDDVDMMASLQTQEFVSPGNLLISVRSQHVAELASLVLGLPMQGVREAMHRSTCTDNLLRITLAMLRYERAHGTLPPAWTADARGNPLHSWRVLLLPYLGQEELFGKIRLDQPWDSQQNRQFHGAAPAVYQCPSAKLQPGRTAYSVVVGPNTPFAAGTGKSLNDFGMNLILVVEREQSVCWMDPASELTAAIAFMGINQRDDAVDGMGSCHRLGMNVGLRDISVQFIGENTQPRLWQTLLDGTAEGRGL